MQAKLKVRPSEGEPFEVEVGNTATIGRGKDNSVSLPTNPHVSRQHAIVRCHNAWQYQIMDLGSRNGTFVNGRRVITPVLLEHGAVIRISNNELVFEQTEGSTPDSTYDVTLATGTDAHHEESAIVAIMVCDIRGFSTMSEILPEDTLARLGGDEFVILLGELEAGHDAALIAEKLIDAFVEPCLIADRELHVCKRSTNPILPGFARP